MSDPSTENVVARALTRIPEVLPALIGELVAARIKYAQDVRLRSHLAEAVLSMPHDHAADDVLGEDSERRPAPVLQDAEYAALHELLRASYVRRTGEPLRTALWAVLAAVAKWETGMDGPSIVGRAFADTVRSTIADALNEGVDLAASGREPDRKAIERIRQIIADHCFGPHKTSAHEERALDIASACTDDMLNEGLLPDVTASSAVVHEQPEWIVISGSMRFWPQMLTVADQCTAAGALVLAPFCSTARDDAHKAMLDTLHCDKIRAVARHGGRMVVVSDGTGYYGASTTSEIQLAQSLSLPVEFRYVVSLVENELCPLTGPNGAPDLRLARWSSSDDRVAVVRPQGDRLAIRGEAPGVCLITPDSSPFPVLSVLVTPGRAVVEPASSVAGVADVLASEVRRTHELNDQGRAVVEFVTAADAEGEVVGATDVLTPEMHRHLIELFAQPYWHPSTPGQWSVARALHRRGYLNHNPSRGVQPYELNARGYALASRLLGKDSRG